MVAWAMEAYLAALDCEVANLADSRAGIFLKVCPERDQYERVLMKGADSRAFKEDMASQSKQRQIYVRQKSRIMYALANALCGF